MKLFSKPPPPREQAKAASRQALSKVRSEQRQLDREVRELDRHEKLLLQQIQQRAKQVTNPASDRGLQSQVRQLVQLRHQRERLMETKVQLGSVGRQTTVMASQVAAVSVLGAVTEAMKGANQAMDGKALTTMAEFAKQSEITKVREEMMNDALASAFDESDEEEDVEEVTGILLAELGVELEKTMGGLEAPKTGIKKQDKAEDLTEEEREALMGLLPDLKTRLDAL